MTATMTAREPMKILVVDDEPDLEALLRQKFRRQIREKEFDFVFAHDGEDALARLREHPEVGIVLTDINMPRMDGLTLLQKLKENHSQVSSVIISAYGDLGNIRTAMNRGAFDFLTKPIDFADLETTIRKTEDYIRQIRDAANNHRQLSAIRQELEIAGNIQRSILPTTFPERAEFLMSASTLPAKEVGGDFFDFFYVEPDVLGFLIGDVSGKGVPAAIFMAMCRTLLRAVALTRVTVSECLDTANRMLCEENSSSMFVTLMYGQLNLRTGHLALCNAGHDHPVIIKSGGNAILQPLAQNLALAVEPEVEFQDFETTLEPGDSILFYTDGITEAENASMELFDKGNVLDTLSGRKVTSPATSIETLFHAVQVFTAGHPQSDDMTAVMVHYRGPGA